MAQPAPTFGYNEKLYALPGFNPLSGYFPSSTYKELGYQVPTLSAAYNKSFGIYYVDNSSNFVELALANGSVRKVAHVIPLYQLYGHGTALNGMLDNEFFIDYPLDQALFFGTTTSTGTSYSIELVNLTSGQLRMWNTSAAVDGTNQGAIYVGNNTVLVLSSNCTIYAFNLASHRLWNAGTVGANFGSGSTCFEANNIFWFPQKRELIDVQAHGGTGDHVEQLNSTANAQGQIQFKSVTTIAVDSGKVFNWVLGLAYNASTDKIAFSAGYFAGGYAYTYVVPYSAQGLLTTTGETVYTALNSTTGPTGRMLEIERYVYTSSYMMGEARGPGWWPNSTQYLFDPWNGSTVLANRSINHIHSGNSGFEGQYPQSPNYLIDYNSTITLNSPMYKVYFAFHGAFTAYPAVSFDLVPSSGPNRTLIKLSGNGYAPSTKYDYCWASNSSAIGCPATRNFTSTSAGGIPTGLTLTRTGGSAWLAISKGSSAAGFTISTPFTVTKANLTPTPGSGPNRTLVALEGNGFAPSTIYNYCWAGNSSAVGCASTTNFTTNGSGGIPSGVTTTRTSGSGWLAISQGTSVTNFIVSSSFTVTTANLSLSPRSGPNGTLVGLVGSGFGPSTKYNYCWAGNSSAVGCGSTYTMTTNSTGGIPTGTAATWAGGGRWLAISQGTSSTNFIVSTSFTKTTATLSISPTRGPSGTQVTLSGAGFANLTGYAFCRASSSSGVGCGSQNVFTTNTTGAIPANVTLAWSGGSGWVAVSQGSSAANFIVSSPFNVTTPTLTLTPGGGPPGTEVSVNGSGLVPSVRYDYCWTTSSAAVGCPSNRTFTSTSAGAIPNGIAFPWPSGNGWLAISQGPSAANFILSSRFQLTTPTLAFSPGQGPNGTLVVLNGSGLALSTVYDYCWAASSTSVGCPATSRFTSTASGAIPAGVTATRSGANGWLAISEGPLSANFIVSSWFPLTVARLTLSPGSGPAGTLTALGGSGFAPATSYDYCWSTSGSATGCGSASTFTTDGVGAIPSGITATRSGGTAWLAISQGTSAANFIVSTVFSATSALLTLTPGSGPNGTIVGLGGSGFAPSTAYDYCWSGSSSAVGCGSTQSFTTNSTGVIPGGVTATRSVGGSWLAISQGGSSTNFIVSSRFTTTVANLSLGPANGPVHTLVVLSGTGFAPDTTYDYCFNASPRSTCPSVHTFLTDGSGAVPAGVELRAPASGNRHLDVSQGPTEPIVSAAFTVTVPALTLGVAGGPANAVTRAVGTGFAGSGAVTLTLGGTNVSGFDGCSTGAALGGTIVSDPAGRFSCSFRIPGSARAGSDGLVATDGSSGATASSAFFVTVPTLVLSTLSAARGDSVDVGGSGFDRQGNVTLTLGHLAIGTIGSCSSGSAQGSTIVTGASGTFACTITIPSTAPVGPTVLTASGEVSGASAGANFTVLSRPTGPMLFGLPEGLGITLLAVVAIGTASLGVLLFLRRRRGALGGAEIPPETAGPGTVPSEEAGFPESDEGSGYQQPVEDPPPADQDGPDPA